MLSHKYNSQIHSRNKQFYNKDVIQTFLMGEANILTKALISPYKDYLLTIGYIFLLDLKIFLHSFCCIYFYTLGE